LELALLLLALGEPEAALLEQLVHALLAAAGGGGGHVREGQANTRK